MFYKVMLKGESQSLPLQGTVKKFSIVIETESPCADFEAFCVGYDQDAKVVASSVVVSMPLDDELFAEAAVPVQWIPSLRRDKPHAQTLLINTECSSEAITEWRLYWSDPSLSVRTQIRCGIHTWETQFIDPNPEACSIFHALTIHRSRFTWLAHAVGAWWHASAKSAYIEARSTLLGIQKNTVEESTSLEDASSDSDEVAEKSVAPVEPVVLKPEWPMPLAGYHELVEAELRSFKIDGYPLRSVIVLDYSEPMRAFYRSGALDRYLHSMAAFMASSHGLQLELVLVNESIIPLEPITWSPDCSWTAHYRLGESDRPMGACLDVTKMVEGVRRLLYPKHRGGATQFICQQESPIWVSVLCGEGLIKDGLSDWQWRWASREPLFWQFVTTSTDAALQSSLLDMQHIIDRDTSNIDVYPLAPTLFSTSLSYPNDEMNEYYQRLVAGYVVWLEEAVARKMIKKPDGKVDASDSFSPPVVIDDIFA